MIATVKTVQRPFLIGIREKQFIGLQRFIVPRSQRFSNRLIQSSNTLINGFLSNRPVKFHFQLSVFMHLIDLVSVLLGGKFFRRLPEVKQKKVAKFFFDSPIKTFRQGFWGISSLSKMGVFMQKEVHQEIGYQLKPLQSSRTISHQPKSSKGVPEVSP